MSAEELGRRVFEMAMHWPGGMRVWHRADGRRGVVSGYMAGIDGAVYVRVDYGSAGGQNELPAVLSAVKVGDGEDEEWKEGVG